MSNFDFDHDLDLKFELPYCGNCPSGIVLTKSIWHTGTPRLWRDPNKPVEVKCFVCGSPIKGEEQSS